MDALSYSYADKQAKRIKRFIENPDSNSGVLTQPKVIASGETVTIPAGRVAVLPNVQVDGTLNVEGEVFIPSGATFGDLESQIALKADTSYVNNKYSGFKNYIINGGFDVWQRGNSFNSIGYYTADRTTSNGDGTGAVSISKQTFSAGDTSVVGAKNYYRFQRTTAGSGSTWTNAYVQNIEELQRFAGKTLTISFWVKNSINSNIYINIQWGYGIGGSSTEAYQYTVPSTTSWTKVSRTFTVPTFSGKTFGANSCMGINISPTYQLNSVYTLDIAQVQLEEGSVATPFEQRPYGLELSLCQRYYETSGTARCEEFRNLTTNSTQYGAVRFNIQKRTSPTVIVYSDNVNIANNVAEGNGNNVPCSLTYIGDTGFRLSWTNTLSTSGASFIYTASAEL